MSGAPAGPLRLRRWGLPIAVSVALVVLAVVIAASSGDSDGGTPRPTQPIGATAVVRRGPVDDVTRAIGQLEPVGRWTVQAGGPGTLTAIDRRKTTDFGESLATIDDRPMVLLRGMTPAWRAFAAGMTAGQDVRQLEEALWSMGYLEVAPDARFRPATTAAINRWQASRGLRPSGVLPLGSIVFRQRPVRILSRRAALGTVLVPGNPILDVASGGKRVSVDLRLAQQLVARPGRVVMLTLPDGVVTRGRVTSVGRPRRPGTSGVKGQAADGGASLLVPVAIRLLRPWAARRFEQGEVSVAFRTTVSRNALTVPVSALVALDGERFGVEVPAAAGGVRRLPVRLGDFVGGRVVVSGAGVREGVRVAVAES